MKLADSIFEYDGLNAYCRQALNTPLLKLKEEKALARKMRRGTQEEREAAREHMILANLRLVVKIAKSFENLGLPLIDLINEGNIGLMIAVERYRLNKGAKVSTYASWWIKQSIRRALSNQVKTIRIPVHRVDQLSKIRKIRESYLKQFEREPSQDEIAEVLGITTDRLNELRGVSEATISLDEPFYNSVDGRKSESIEDMFEDPDAIMPGDHAATMDQHVNVAEILDCLDPRARTIIEYRYGLNGANGEAHTLEQVGQKFGVTRERIRQIQEKALRKLRGRLNKRNNVQDPDMAKINPDYMSSR